MASYYKYGTNLGDRTYFTSTIVNSAGEKKRYFSNVESEIYFGNKRIDDINQFSFGIDEKVLPIYGYNCFYPSELVSGQRIVQGQFVLNFTDRGVIKETLDSIDDSVYASKHTEKYSPGGGRDHALWDKNFDIMLGYGYYGINNIETHNATCQSIIGAKITGMQKVMDTTGQPLLEVYNFIAKDFVEEEIKEVEVIKEDESPKKDESNNKPEDLKYVCSNLYNPAQITSNTNYCANNAGCVHLIHNMVFDDKSGTITMQVSGGNKEAITIKSGTINITEQIESDTVMPVLNFSTTSKSVATIDMKKTYSDIIKKLKSQWYFKIKCTVSYSVKVSDKEMDITFKDAYIYI